MLRGRDRLRRRRARGSRLIAAPGTRPALPELPLDAWEETKTTLHLWSQIVGKVRMASTAPRNHWWNVTLYVDVRGLTTRRLHAPGEVVFQIDFDFLDHRLVVRTNEGGKASFELADGLSVAAFDEQLHATLAELGVDVRIRETPFSMPVTTPFTADREHARYDADAVERFWRILDWTDGVLEEYAGRYRGKSSPVHLFWHSFDLAVARFGGKPAPERPGADAVTREAYSHEMIACGFWPGDQNVPEPAYYSYTAPEPEGLRRAPLEPDGARWIDQGGGSLALLPYEAVRTAAHPRATLLAFLESAYQAGAAAAGWDREALAWSPQDDVPAPTTEEA